ncbi:MAG: bifunctional 5,10-methylenetetrahydrofolate dehydrogenase/5,10-methenyltetrahydrofolate cyclohydrolase [Oligoflexales bacterium]|nr:bifunctional 5,10-methylenetetrahydrofolate dehydrogenase/5,10-methenyltetrahydrofolate cyclohydrolase [Oligoflexales bacterium]
MTAKKLEGTKLAKAIRLETKEAVQSRVSQGNRAPSLSVILIGDDPASKIYVNQKEKACHEVGVHSKIYHLPTTVKQEELEHLIKTLNEDASIDGILLQLPLPQHLNRSQCLDMIRPSKDVDGLTSYNQGAVLTKIDGLYPCTPLGIMELLNQCDSLVGKKVVLVGYSLLVGAPLSSMLIHSGATVTVITKNSLDSPSIAKDADILVVAAGVRHLVDRSWVKEGAILIDVGIHRDGNSLSGDVDYDDVKSVVSAVTPVPGGVGPLTVAFLLKNCFEAYLKNLI